MDDRKSLTYMILGAAALFCISFLIAVFVLTSTYKNRQRANDTITITGLAKREFVSDLILWKGQIEKRGRDLKATYDALKTASAEVRKFLQAKGLKEADFSFSAVNIRKEYEHLTKKHKTEDGQTVRSVRRFKGYVLSQELQIESLEVDRIEKLSREINELYEKGIEFDSSLPQYFYTKLGQLKIGMIAEATRDGKLRAQKILENAGGKISALRDASLGVFQITNRHSTSEFTWSGAFDTANKKKMASVTIKLQFGLEM